MTKEEFVVQLDYGAYKVSSYPVSSAVLRWCAEQLKRGEPAWWKGVAKAWEKRRLGTWSEGWGTFLAALHFEALNDADSPLVKYFPSCGGTGEADPAPGLARFFAAPPPSFFANLRDRRLVAYVGPSSAAWVGPAMLYFQRRGLPFYLVELNAGAGLNLIGDLMSEKILGQKNFDASLIAARIGLEGRPLDTTDLADRRWLTAGILPDNAFAIAHLDGSIDLLQKRLREEPTFVQMVPCPFDKALAFVAKNIPADDPDVGLLLFNTGVTSRVDEASYAATSAAIAAALKPWGDRGLWVEAEPVRGDATELIQQTRAHRLIDGSLKSIIMATFNLASKTYAYSEASESFLDARPPAK